MKAKVKFLPQDVELEIDSDESVMQLAHRNKIFIHSVCNGQPACTECMVRVSQGEHNCLPPFEKELSLIGSGHFLDGRRLSCQIKCFGDITVDLSQQVEKQKNKPRPHIPRQNLGRQSSSQNSQKNEVSFAVMDTFVNQSDKTSNKKPKT